MFPRLLDIGPLHLASYGLFVALGYLVGILWLKSQRERMGLTEERFWPLIYAAFFGAVAGGKAMFLSLSWESFASGQMSLLRDFRYGFVFYGGVLGSVLAGWLYARRQGIPFASIVDYFAVAGPIGHAIGRLGCLGAGCCYGAPTDKPWGITFTRPDSLVPEPLLGVRLHPAQLYESAGNLLIAWLVWRSLQRVQAGTLRPGTPFAFYVVLYAFLRFAIETLRADERGAFLLGLSPAQWTALGFVACACLWEARRRGRPA